MLTSIYQNLNTFFSKFSCSRYDWLMSTLFLAFLISCSCFFELFFIVSSDLDFGDISYLMLSGMWRKASQLGRTTTLRKQGSALVDGIPHQNYQTFREIHTFVKVAPSGVPSQGHTKAKGHYACADLSPEEIRILQAGSEIEKDGVLIATSQQIVDGKLTIFICETNLKGNVKNQFTLAAFVDCKILEAGITPALEAWDNLKNAAEEMAKNNGTL